MNSDMYFTNGYPGDQQKCDDGMMWDTTTQKCITDPSKNTTITPWWSWVLIIITMGAIIGFIIWFIIWSKSTNNQGSVPSALDITGVEYKVLSTTSIGATWTAVANPKDEVVLYVNPSGESMDFSKGGAPLGTYNSSGKVSGSSRSAIVSGLMDKTSYDAVVVVTNPDFPGQSFRGRQESGIHTSGVIPPGPKFQIAASSQTGYINYDLTPPEGISPFVSYKRGTTSPNTSLFHYDSDGFICVTTQGQTVTATTLCDNGSSVLYSGTLFLGSTPTTGFVGQNQLRIATKSSLSTAEMAAAKWQYNPNGDNKWCLTSGTGCMEYNAESPDIVVVGVTGATGATGTIGTTGVFTAATGSTGSPNQAIFVSSTGSKWNNVTFSS